MTPKDSQEILDIVKKAQSPLETALHNASQQKADLLNQQALGLIGKVMLGSLGAGMAMRGAKGLYNAMKPVKAAPPQPTIIDIPLKKRKEKLANIFSDLVSGASNVASDVMSSRMADTVQGVPGLMPGLALGGGLAGYGGWKLMDKVLDDRRKQELEDDVAAAQQRYRSALLSQYKTAEESELGQALDQLAEKAAADWPGMAAGAYLTAAPILALIAATKGYGAGVKRTKRYTIEKARELKAKQQARQQAPEIFARPIDLPEAPETQQDAEQMGALESSV